MKCPSCGTQMIKMKEYVGEESWINPEAEVDMVEYWCCKRCGKEEEIEK